MKKKPTAPVDLWDELAEIEKHALVVRPPNSFTSAEYAEKRGMSRNLAKGTLDRLAKLGKIRRVAVPGSPRIYWQMVS